MRILVSGSTGLIGTALIESLSGAGHHVVRLVRPGTLPGGERRDGVTAVAWDPVGGSLDPSILDAAGPFDGVVHLAGAGVGDKRWSRDRKQVILESRTGPTNVLARALAACDVPPPVLVSASAIGVYGDRGQEVLTEASPTGSGFLADVCTAWEQAAIPITGTGVRTVHLRTGIVLSAHGGALARQLPLFRIGLGGRTGSGRQYRSWITLEDEVGVIMRCLTDTSLGGPVNATAPDPVTDSALAKALGTALHRPSVLPVPAPALKLALGSEMATDMVLASQRVVPSKLLAAGHTFRHTDVTGAVRAVLGT